MEESTRNGITYDDYVIIRDSEDLYERVLAIYRRKGLSPILDMSIYRLVYSIFTKILCVEEVTPDIYCASNLFRRIAPVHDLSDTFNLDYVENAAEITNKLFSEITPLSIGLFTALLRSNSCIISAYLDAPIFLPLGYSLLAWYEKLIAHLKPKNWQQYIEISTDTIVIEKNGLSLRKPLFSNYYTVHSSVPKNHTLLDTHYFVAVFMHTFQGYLLTGKFLSKSSAFPRVALEYFIDETSFIADIVKLNLWQNYTNSDAVTAFVSALTFLGKIDEKKHRCLRQFPTIQLLLKHVAFNPDDHVYATETICDKPLIRIAVDETGTVLSRYTDLLPDSECLSHLLLHPVVHGALNTRDHVTDKLVERLGIDAGLTRLEVLIAISLPTVADFKILHQEHLDIYDKKFTETAAYNVSRHTWNLKLLKAAAEEVLETIKYQADGYETILYKNPGTILFSPGSGKILTFGYGTSIEKSLQSRAVKAVLTGTASWADFICFLRERHLKQSMCEVIDLVLEKIDPEIKRAVQEGIAMEAKHPQLYEIVTHYEKKIDKSSLFLESDDIAEVLRPIAEMSNISQVLKNEEFACEIKIKNKPSLVVKTKIDNRFYVYDNYDPIKDSSSSRALQTLNFNSLVAHHFDDNTLREIARYMQSKHKRNVTETTNKFLDYCCKNFTYMYELLHRKPIRLVKGVAIFDEAEGLPLFKTHMLFYLFHSTEEDRSADFLSYLATKLGGKRQAMIFSRKTKLPLFFIIENHSASLNELSTWLFCKTIYESGIVVKKWQLEPEVETIHFSEDSQAGLHPSRLASKVICALLGTANASSHTQLAAHVAIFPSSLVKSSFGSGSLELLRAALIDVHKEPAKESRRLFAFIIAAVAYAHSKYAECCGLRTNASVASIVEAETAPLEVISHSEAEKLTPISNHLYVESPMEIEP